MNRPLRVHTKGFRLQRGSLHCCVQVNCWASAPPAADGGPVEFLQLPQGYSGGNAVAVSNDGRLIAGNLRAGGRVGISQAAVWRDGSSQILTSTQPWSAVGGNPFEANVAYTARRTHPMTYDGSVDRSKGEGSFRSPSSDGGGVGLLLRTKRARERSS